MCDRILVMRQGKVESVVEKAEFDRSEMLRSAFGEERRDERFPFVPG